MNPIPFLMAHVLEAYLLSIGALVGLSTIYQYVYKRYALSAPNLWLYWWPRHWIARQSFSSFHAHLYVLRRQLLAGKDPLQAWTSFLSGSRHCLCTVDMILFEDYYRMANGGLLVTKESWMRDVSKLFYVPYLTDFIDLATYCTFQNEDCLHVLEDVKPAQHHIIQALRWQLEKYSFHERLGVLQNIPVVRSRIPYQAIQSLGESSY